jgi:DNA polymerase IV (DinB-like DNA polymerase)
MDHFYTAVEEREHPEIKGKPVIVGSNPKEGKAEASYPQAMRPEHQVSVQACLFPKLAACPKAVYLPLNFPLYIQVPGEIMALSRKHAEV